MTTDRTDRRQFLRTAAGAALATAAVTGAPQAATRLLAAGAAPTGKPRLKKAVKYGMIRVDGASVKDKFELVKSLGFQGVEVDSRDSPGHGNRHLRITRYARWLARRPRPARTSRARRQSAPR